MKCATGGGSEATGSHGFERLPGGLMDEWVGKVRTTAAAAIMSRHCRNVRSKVPVKRAATHCQVVEHERNKISAAIRCVLWGRSLQGIVGGRWGSGSG